MQWLAPHSPGRVAAFPRLTLEAKDLAMGSGQPLFELLDALTMDGAFAAESLGEATDHRAVAG
ncbi:hypothetical protein AB0O91_38170 [Kitasatospora sp. NPDC089797]|uniref:hypothetical protein n=1 Tax=Kitasatospora sp. NPDC089797 TaxID=3155298 RepID=UPI00341A264F